MSIIETAMSKARERDAGRVITEPVISARRTKIAEVPVVAAPAQAPREYQPFKVDTVAMERNCLLPGVSDQAALRAYKILRTRLLQRMVAHQWHSFAITGTESEQGKTLTAINLSISLAQDPNTSVFLVDLDLQRPRVAKQMGMTVERGLSDYLLGTAEIEQIIYDADIPRLSVIPNFRAFEHSSEMLGGLRMLDLLRYLEADTPRRIIIFDMPPMLLADDVLTFAPQVDGVVLVVSEGLTTRATVKKAQELLVEMNLIGVVLNRSAERDSTGYY